MQHTDWQDMIPFYVAGTLSPQEQRQFEHYMAQCGPVCQQEIEEWQIIGQAVRVQAQTWSRGLPPISARIRKQLAYPVEHEAPEAPPTVARDGIPPVIAFDPQVSYTPTTAAQRRQRQIRVPLTLVASFITLFFFVAMLLVLTNQPTDDDDTDTGSPPEIAGNFTDTPEPTPWATNTNAPTELGIIDVPTILATSTPRPIPSTVPPTPLIFSTPLPTDPPIGMGGGMGGAGNTEDLNMMILPPEEATSLPPTGVCSVSVTGGAIVNIYQYPGRQYPLTGTIYPGTYFTVFTQDGGGWYEIGAPGGGIAGWVVASEVNFHPGCDSLPVPTPTISIDSDPTMCTLSPLPEVGRIDIYANPDRESLVLAAVQGNNNYAVAMGITANNWYRARYSVGASVWVGWIHINDVVAAGACDILPRLSTPQTATLTPTRTAVAAPTATVTMFTAEPAAVAPGGVFLLSWSVQNAVQVGITVTDPTGTFPLHESVFVPAGTPTTFANTGRLQVTVPTNYTQSSLTFSLVSADSGVGTPIGIVVVSVSN